jgi:hypothetical protein
MPFAYRRAHSSQPTKAIEAWDGSGTESRSSDRIIRQTGIFKNLCFMVEDLQLHSN